MLYSQTMSCILVLLNVSKAEEKERRLASTIESMQASHMLPNTTLRSRFGQSVSVTKKSETIAYFATPVLNPPRLIDFCRQTKRNWRNYLKQPSKRSGSLGHDQETCGVEPELTVLLDQWKQKVSQNFPFTFLSLSAKVCTTGSRKLKHGICFLRLLHHICSIRDISLMQMVYYGYLWFTAFRRKKKKRALLERQTPWRHQPPTFCLLNCSRHWGSETDWLAICAQLLSGRERNITAGTKNSPERRERGPLCQQMSTVSLVFDDHVWLYVLPHPKYAGGHEFLSQIWSAFFRQAEEKEKKINKRLEQLQVASHYHFGAFADDSCYLMWIQPSFPADGDAGPWQPCKSQWIGCQQRSWRSTPSKSRRGSA